MSAPVLQHHESGGPDWTAVRLSILSATLFLPLGLHLPYFPVWLAARGLNDSEIVTALGAPLILRMFATPLIATLADLFGIAKTLALCAITMAAGYFALGRVEGFAPILVFAVIVTTALGAMPSLADALTLSEIRRAELAGRRPIVFGHVRVWTSISVLLMMLASGRIVEIFPGGRIVAALAGVASISAVAAVLATAGLRKTYVSLSAKGGLTADFARLRLALACIGAAALIQSSHALVYSFATLQWRQAGLSPDFISAAWAIGVASEAVLFLANARYFGTERHAVAFLVLGGSGAALRWLAMSGDPGPSLLLGLQAMHGLSFGATYCGAVLLLGALAGPTHRARMQGWLAASTALSLAAATFACGPLIGRFGQHAYLVMMALALAGGALALVAGALKRRLPGLREEAAQFSARSEPRSGVS